MGVQGGRGASIHAGHFSAVGGSGSLHTRCHCQEQGGARWHLIGTGVSGSGDQQAGWPLSIWEESPWPFGAGTRGLLRGCTTASPSRCREQTQSQPAASSCFHGAAQLSRDQARSAFLRWIQVTESERFQSEGLVCPLSGTSLLPGSRSTSFGLKEDPAPFTAPRPSSLIVPRLPAQLVGTLGLRCLPFLSGCCLGLLPCPSGCRPHPFVWLNDAPCAFAEPCLSTCLLVGACVVSSLTRL